jgi:hypothetical protein
MRLAVVPPTSVEFAPEEVPTSEPDPPVTELLLPPKEKVVVPAAAPKRVVAAEEAETVSFRDAKTVDGVVVEMELPPVGVESTIEFEPEIVRASPEAPMTSGPPTVDAPLAITTE